jgi:hypothetical protein
MVAHEYPHGRPRPSRYSSTSISMLVHEYQHARPRVSAWSSTTLGMIVHEYPHGRPRPSRWSRAGIPIVVPAPGALLRGHSHRPHRGRYRRNRARPECAAALRRSSCSLRDERPADRCAFAAASHASSCGRSRRTQSPRGSHVVVRVDLLAGGDRHGRERARRAVGASSAAGHAGAGLPLPELRGAAPRLREYRAAHRAGLDRVESPAMLRHR